MSRIADLTLLDTSEKTASERLPPPAMQEAGMMAAMRHPNVVMYLGVCLDPPCVITEYCARGSLNDVLKRALKERRERSELGVDVSSSFSPPAFQK